MIEKASEKLCNIGFTQLESEVYLFLLMHSANTGYATAKGIGKPVANVYKAIESLAHKGAIEYSMGDSKLCNAVAWKQLLATQQKNFSDNLDTLSDCLEQLPDQQQDEQVYQMHNAKQVLDQAIATINNAEAILLADIDPSALEKLSQPLIEAANRGVEVRVKLYQAAELPGVHITLRQNGEDVYEQTNDIQFNLCADGNAMTIALFTADLSSVIQAFRSESALMALSLHNKLLYELVLTQLKEVIPSGDITRAQHILETTQHLHVFSSKNAVFESFNQRYKHHRETTGTPQK